MTIQIFVVSSYRPRGSEKAHSTENITDLQNTIAWCANKPVTAKTRSKGKIMYTRVMLVHCCLQIKILQRMRTCD